MQAANPNKEAIPLTPRIWVVSGISLLALSWIAFRIWGPLNPDAVRRRAIDAVEKKDARGLLSLANPEEIRRLHLSEEGVLALLDATYWKQGTPKLNDLQFERDWELPVDMAEYPAFKRGATTTDKPLFVLAVSDSLDEGWRLDLTWLFYSYFRLSGDDVQARVNYIQACRHSDILGMKDSHSVYHSIEEIERRAKEIETTGR